MLFRIFRLYPSVCHNMIFRNSPSRIDKNSSRFLTKNENFLLIVQASENLRSIEIERLINSG